MENPITRVFSLYKGLSRSIYVLFGAHIVNSVGSFVYPFLTMFLTQRLGMAEGLAGLLITLSGLSFIPGSLIGGKLADQIGRKKVLVTAQLLAAACFIPCGFLGESMAIPVLIILADFFHGFSHPCYQAMATDLTVPENRQASFSLLYLGHNLGFAVGPLIAGFLYTHYTPLLFWGDATTTILAVLAIIAFVPETLPSSKTVTASLETEGDGKSGGPAGIEDGEKAEAGSLFTALFKRPFLLAFTLILPAVTFVYANMSFSLPLFSIETFADRGPVIFGSLMTTNALVVVFLTPVIIALTKQWKPILNVSLAALLYAVGFGMLYFVHTIVMLVVSAVIWTVGEILFATNIEVYIANHTPISHRGRFNAVLPLVIECGYFTAPPLLGAFMEYNPVRMVWPLAFFLACAACLALLILYFVERRYRRKAV